VAEEDFVREGREEGPLRGIALVEAIDPLRDRLVLVQALVTELADLQRCPAILSRLLVQRMTVGALESFLLDVDSMGKLEPDRALAALGQGQRAAQPQSASDREQGRGERDYRSKAGRHGQNLQ
jgi:hypothetical protein